MLALTVFAVLILGGLYLLDLLREPKPLPEFTEEQIKQKWRDLGFFCELDHEDKLWTLTGSLRGLLFFPDLLLGYASDPENSKDGTKKKYGPYGTLEIMTWPEPGFGNSIRGSSTALAHLAEIVEAKLASAQAGDQIQIREEYASDNAYTLLLDVRADGFDPASTDRERLGSLTSLSARKIETNTSPPNQTKAENPR
jgi:hypothetical protein